MTTRVLAVLLVSVAAAARHACDDEKDVVELLRGSFDLQECAATKAEELSESKKTEVETQLRRLELTIKNVRLAMASQEKKVVTPAFQWAQSGDAIYISVKFAHKLDAPGALVGADDVEDVDFDETKVSLRAEAKDKRFELHLALLRPLANCSWSSGSVGRGTLTLSKRSREWWPRLLASKTGRAPTWWDKQEAYDHEKEDVQREEKRRKQERAKLLREQKEEPANNSSSSNATANATADRADPSAAVSEAENATAAVETSPDDVAARRAAAKIRKSAAQRKKDLDDDARDRKRAVSDQAKADIAAIDADLAQAKTAVDADTEKALLRDASSFFVDPPPSAAAELQSPEEQVPTDEL